MKNCCLLLLLCFVTVQSKSIITKPPSTSVPLGPFYLYNYTNNDTTESPPADDREQGYETKNLFEGDIKDPGRRTGGKIREAGTRTPWPNGIIPYVFDCSVLSIKSALEATKAAIEEWESRTCVRFVKKQKHHKVYLEFIRSNGCWASYVGYKGKKTQISIGYGCEAKNVMVHELGHVIGFWHEQSRPDRDQYITINERHIIHSEKPNFNIVKEQINHYGEPYDLNSIMHYPFDAFANGKDRKTISTKDPKLQNIVRPYKELSESDVRQTKRMYQCDKIAAARATTTKTIGKAKRINLASIGGQCRDEHRNCKSWAKADFCSLSPDPMLKTCPESCGVCSEVCKDNTPECSAWADYGYCVRSAKNTDHTLNYMLNNCKKSCGVCIPASAAKPTTQATTKRLPPTTISPQTTTPTHSTKAPTTLATTDGSTVITKGGIRLPSRKFTGVFCEDTRPAFCKELAEAGRCKTDLWMLENCQLSCRNFKVCDRNVVKPLGPCTDVLGVHNKAVIPNSRMYGTSTYRLSKNWDAPASSARLYKRDDKDSGHIGAWCADPYVKRDNYLQIDFGNRKSITALATQGRYRYFEHVKSYSLSFSDDGSSWYDYRERGDKKIFDGNCDHVTPVLNLLENAQYARYIRIHPIKYIGAACLRVEVYGCNA